MSRLRRAGHLAYKIVFGWAILLSLAGVAALQTIVDVGQKYLGS